MEAIKETFFQECDEQLSALESGLTLIGEGTADPDTVNAVFRAVHSIKGGAGAFALTDLVRFAHVFETVLDELRSDRIQADQNAIRIMLRAADVLADLVGAARSGARTDDEQIGTLLDEIRQLSAQPTDQGPTNQGPNDCDKNGPAAETIDDFDFVPVMVATIEPAYARSWSIGLFPRPELYANANETMLLLRELGRLGPVSVTLDDRALPALADLDTSGSYLSWHIQLSSDYDENSIREVFDFVENDCELSIIETFHTAVLDDAEDDDVSLSALVLQQAADPDATAGAYDTIDIAALLLQASGKAPALTLAPTLAPTLARTPAPTSAPRERPAGISPSSAGATPALTDHPTGERLRPGSIAAGPAAPKSRAPAPTAPTATTADAGNGTIRVDLARVDRLIDLVGELVINEAMLNQRVLEAGLARTSGMATALDGLAQLTREIQDSVMAIRAQPVRSVFQRMPRLVREVAALTGKSVRLVTEGEGTEVDKTVIERLADPITHMIRNAIDHGLETSELRRAAGKPEEGVVRLSALHRSGRIVIEVADDGAGINRARVRQKAIEHELIAADATLTDEETDNLIFLPGFSTASSVSDISGRGVGMDVVKRSVQALGGRISITSRPGAGSTFTLSLPLTLAVLDGMVVDVGGHTLIVPLSPIIETLQPLPGQVHPLGQGARVILLRGGYIPLLDVGIALGYRASAPQSEHCVAMLVEGESGQRAVLMVDRIVGQRQIVIKSLETNYGAVPGIAAATVMGDGRVALILDVDAIVSASRGDLTRQDLSQSDFTLAMAG